MRITFQALARISAVAALLAFTTNCGEQRATGLQHSKAAANASASTLISCPTNTTQSTSALSGVLGGTVSLGGSSITIPSGALSLPTLITVTLPAGQYMEVDVQANNLTSFLFNQPVSITIDYARCNQNLSGDTLTVWNIDQQTKALIQDMGGVNDAANQSITFTTGHLSGYAVAF